jgi:PIN domain nuclease of toxin-antitoxin system
VRLLLDTSTFLWIVLGAPELSDRASDAFADPGNEVYLSAVSAWEIAIKSSIGRLPLPDRPDRFIPVQRHAHGIVSLPLDEESAFQLPRLPPVHSDPFDRMLVCQAIVHGLVLVTPDEQIARYPVRVLW